LHLLEQVVVIDFARVAVLHVTVLAVMNRHHPAVGTDGRHVRRDQQAKRLHVGRRVAPQLDQHRLRVVRPEIIKIGRHGQFRKAAAQVNVALLIFQPLQQRDDLRRDFVGVILRTGHARGSQQTGEQQDSEF